MNETYGKKSKDSLSRKVLFFGPPFKTQIIWLSISSLLLVAWGGVNGYLNVMILLKKQASWDACCETINEDAHMAAVIDWIDAENSRDSWAQGRTLVALFWLITIVAITYSVVKVTAKLTEGSRNWNGKWAIGGWFIPLANLFIPFLVMRESERIIKDSLDKTKAQDLAVSESLDTGRIWFVGNILVLGLFGASAELIANAGYREETFGLWCAVLASALLAAVVVLAFRYFAKQNVLINQTMVFPLSTSNEEKSGQRRAFEPPSPSFGGTQDAGTISEQIRHLGKLRDDGLITPLEFEQKKIELLNRI